MELSEDEYDDYYNYYRQYQLRRKRIAAVVLGILCDEEMERKKRRFWVAPLFRIRESSGFFKAVFPVLHLEDLRFHNYIGMSATHLENLLRLVGADIHKQYVIREPIDTAQRLVLTLRFLASGDCITSMSYQYLVGVTTAGNIIYEVCRAIWNNLQPLVLPGNCTQEKWYKIAAEYEEMWNFPHCVGAMDGKHIVIQCPMNAGSTYFNYKGTHSIVLLAMCTAKYVFSFVDIGSYGRRSDGGIFKENNFGVNFENGKLNIPPASAVCDNGPVLPFCILGDEAFPFKPNLLRPYPGKSIDSQEKRIFNYRLSRARRTIENSFGIMSNRWRIFRKPILSSSKHAKEITPAVVCLHNMLRIQDLEDEEVNIKYVTADMVDRDGEDGLIAGSWTNDVGTGLKEITRMGNNGGTRAAFEVHDKFCHYFSNEGSVDWQYNYL